MFCLVRVAAEEFEAALAANSGRVKLGSAEAIGAWLAQLSPSG
jgi:hypothetical protein